MDHLGVYFDRRLVGNVTVDDIGRFSFEYDASWIGRADSFAISQSLPLEVGKHEEGAGHAFFANLLPEGHVRQLVARRLGLSGTMNISPKTSSSSPRWLRSAGFPL